MHLVSDYPFALLVSSFQIRQRQKQTAGQGTPGSHGEALLRGEGKQGCHVSLGGEGDMVAASASLSHVEVACLGSACCEVNWFSP